MSKKGGDAAGERAVKRMNERLKSCPFCGGNAMIIQVDLKFESILNDKWIIGCDGINGSLCPGYIYKCSPIYTSRELAVKMWNNRDGERR